MALEDWLGPPSAPREDPWGAAERADGFQAGLVAAEHLGAKANRANCAKATDSAAELVHHLETNLWPCDPDLIQELKALAGRVSRGHVPSPAESERAMALMRRTCGALVDPDHPDRLLSGADLERAVREEL